MAVGDFYQSGMRSSYSGLIVSRLKYLDSAIASKQLSPRPNFVLSLIVMTEMPANLDHMVRIEQMQLCASFGKWLDQSIVVRSRSVGDRFLSG